MTSRIAVTMRRLFIALLAGVISCSASAKDIELGGRQIAVPLPDGFVVLTAEMQPFYDMMNAYQSPDNIRFFSLLGARKAHAFLRGHEVEVGRFMKVEAERDINRGPVSSDDFARLRQSYSSHLQKKFDAADDRLKDIIEQGNESLSELLDAGVDGEVGSRVVYPVHLDTPDRLAFSSITVASGSIDGLGGGTMAFTGTTMIVHVRGKVLTLSVHGRDTDLRWTRIVAADWADEIIAANSATAEGRAKQK